MAIFCLGQSNAGCRYIVDDNRLSGSEKEMFLDFFSPGSVYDGGGIYLYCCCTGRLPTVHIYRLLGRRHRYTGNCALVWNIFEKGRQHKKIALKLSLFADSL
jgi:hypothetical protein